MHSATSYDTKLTPHKPSLSSCAWLCHQSALLPGAFFYYPTFHFQRAIKLLHFFFFNPCRIRLSINLRAVAKVDSRSLPPVAPRSNLTLPNPAVPRSNRRPQSHPRSGGRALLDGRPLSPEGQGRAGRRSRINPAGTSSI